MSNFSISYDIIDTYQIDIVEENEEIAMQKFYAGEYAGKERITGDKNRGNIRVIKTL